MAGERTLPGAGLTAFWNLGDNTYKPDMDTNFQLVSALLAGSVKSRTTSLPGTPTLGDIYIVPSGDTNGNDLAIWDGESGSEAWVYVTPNLGWSFYIDDTDDNYQWNGTSWVEFAGAGGGGGASAIDDLSDVDTSTVAPTDGQVLSWDNAGGNWTPADAGSGGGDGYSETVVFEQDYGATSGTAFDFSIDEYDEIRITGNNTTNTTLVLELSTDDGSSYVTTGGYYENWVQGSNDGGGTVDHIDLSGSGSGRWRLDLQSHNFATHPTRALLYYGNGSNFFEIGETRTFANAAHNRARVNFTGSMTSGVVQVIGIKYGAGGSGGGGGATNLGDLADVSTAGGTGDVLTKQSDGSFDFDAPAASSGIATHSTGDFGVGTASPDKQLHVLTDPGAASILPGTVPDSGGILIEANGLGAGATGSFPGITMCSVDAGCTHIHSINASGHWVHESEINFPTKEWRVRIDNETDGSRPAQRMSMRQTGATVFDDLTNDSATEAPYEGRLKVRGMQNGASPTEAVFNIRQDYNAAGKNPAIFLGMDQTFGVNQLLVEAVYQNDWSSDIHFHVRDTTSGADGLNDPYSNMTEALTLKGDGALVGVGVIDPATKLHVDGAMTLNEQSADPANPSEGRTVMWMSDGTGSGDDGDIMLKITAGGTTKTVTLIDFSAA